jgi:predicted acetyltransferase
MPELVLPPVEVHQSFVRAIEEFVAEGRGAADDDTMIGAEIREWHPGWITSDVFDEFVTQLRRQAEENAPRPAGFVPCTSYWWVEGHDYLGRLAIRHRLTDTLLERGGHIGYDVRPAARRRGHATAMLAAARPLANALGIDPALVTCDTTNHASRKVIEANGGILEDQRDGKLRYWMPTVTC